MNLGIHFLFAVGLVLLCFAGIGVGVLIGRRRDIKGCACEFDAERARGRHAARGGGAQTGGCDQCRAPTGCDQHGARGEGG